MLVKFFRNGNVSNKSYSTGGNGVRDYLLNNRVEKGTARLLQGDPDQTTEIINGLGYSSIYTSGCLAFEYAESKKINEKMKQEMMDGFERALFGDFDKSRISGYWVEHTDKDRLELNFVFANVDLLTGNALPVYYHAVDKYRVNDFKDLVNMKYDLADPNDPNRQRLTVTKDINQCKTQQEIKLTLNDMIVEQFNNNQINNRDDVIKFLTDDLGFKIGRKSDKFLSIIQGDSKPIRLKGLFYEQQFDKREYISEPKNEGTPIKHRDDKDGKPSLSELSERLESAIQTRTSSLNKRFETAVKRLNDQLQRHDTKYGKSVKDVTADNQRPTASNKFTHYTAQPKPSPYNTENYRHQRKPKPTNDTRLEKLATADNKRSSQNELPTTTINDFHNPHASRWTSNNANTNNMVESLQHTRLDQLSFDNSSHHSLGNISNNDQQSGGRLNERNYANDTNNVKSSINQFTDTAKQFFETVTDSAKSSYQRLSDTTSRVTESFRKYANQHTEQHSRIVSAVGTATETNQQLRTLNDSAERTNKELDRTSYRAKQATNYLHEAITSKQAEQLRQEQQKQKQAELIKQQTPKPQKPQVDTPKPKAEPPKRKFRM